MGSKAFQETIEVKYYNIYKRNRLKGKKKKMINPLTLFTHADNL